jgi:hypothetical protein
MMTSGGSSYPQISLKYAEKRELNQHSAETIGIPKKPAFTSVYAVATNCSIQAQSLTLAQAGRAFIKP